MLFEIFAGVFKATFYGYPASPSSMYNQEAIQLNEPVRFDNPKKKSVRKLLKIKNNDKISLYADNCTKYMFDLKQSSEELITQMCLKTELFQNKFYNVEELIRITNIKKLSLDHYKDQNLNTSNLQRYFDIQKHLCFEVEYACKHENIRTYIGFKTFLSVFKSLLEILNIDITRNITDQLQFAQGYSQKPCDLLKFLNVVAPVCENENDFSMSFTEFDSKIEQLKEYQELFKEEERRLFKA